MSYRLAAVCRAERISTNQSASPSPQMMYLSGRRSVLLFFRYVYTRTAADSHRHRLGEWHVV